MNGLIDSPANPLIKETAALQQKKERQARNQILVETRHPIEEALAAGLTLVHYFQQGEGPALVSLPEGTQITPLSERAMARLSSTDTAPSCVAVFESPKPVSQPSNLQKAFVLLLDQVQDPGNAGTLIRSAVAFGITQLVLTPGSVEVYSPKVIRASAGLVFRLPVLELSALPSGWNFYLATAHTLAGREPVSYREVSYTSPAALVLGNEGRGISEGLLDSLNPLGTLTPITIAMPGAVESLNVGVSGSIILAEAAARRSGAGVQ